MNTSTYLSFALLLVVDGCNGPAIEKAPSGGGAGEFVAAHWPLPIVKNSGGPILKAPRVHIYYFTGDELATEVSQFVAQLGESQYWRTVVAEYGVGALSVLGPFSTNMVAPDVLDDTVFQGFLYDEITEPVTDQDIFMFLLPSGTSVTRDNTAFLCGHALGYHSEAVLQNGLSVPYAVIGRCPKTPEAALNFVATVATHELVEASTDPFFYSRPAYRSPSPSDGAWFRYPGGELGDLCVLQSYYDAELGMTLPEFWSNAAVIAGDNPCRPNDPSAVYFNASPSGMEPVTIKVNNQQIQTVGYVIPVGSTRVIDLDLFSNASTPLWNVLLAQWPTPSVGSQSDLDFSLDRTTGQNGDHLKVAIHVLQDSLHSGFHIALIESKLGETRQFWPFFITNS